MTVGFSMKSADLIIQRDEGRCVCCGMPAREKHHRRRRRVDYDGLAHDPSNGILLCGWGNHLGCHGLAHSRPTWAKQRGLIVPPHLSPRDEPVLHYSRGLVLLDGTGGWRAA